MSSCYNLMALAEENKASEVFIFIFIFWRWVLFGNDAQDTQAVCNYIRGFSSKKWTSCALQAFGVGLLEGAHRVSLFSSD